MSSKCRDWLSKDTPPNVEGMPKWWVNTQAIINYILTFIFTLECVMKIIGLGWKEFISDSFNAFDLIVVFISLVEIIWGWISGSGGGTLSALRTLRITRIFKLTRRWKALSRILESMQAKHF